ncbi:hypothetical protein E4U31_007993 [Claviceps sp. LM219 group G6]|nr:hypothetical protein E4U15_006638 [Claviceps sp. LM218 group G6]KAG6089952.1 hypothetical protein E4U31_007993 [Claviceps sp. LM219 group G6]KAG6095407.1 hypothetical protein E4U14_008248 [Claviceps sp. LM454 group G7]
MAMLTMSLPSQLPLKDKSSKRKRRNSDSGPPFSAQQKGIKSFSRSTTQQGQSTLAGFTEHDEEEPWQDTKNFPHRRLHHAHFGFTGSTDDEQGFHKSIWLRPDPVTSEQPKAVHRGTYLDMLLRSTHQLLDEGKVGKSAKLFGIIIQLRLGGRPIDIRQYNLWAIGAEIIMRTGEEETMRELGLPNQSFNSVGSYTRIRIPGRWGSNTNISRLKAYLEELMQKYPYDRKFPNAVSAIDFQLALFACEIFNCRAEFTAEAGSLDEGQVSYRVGATFREVALSNNSRGMENEHDETTSPDRRCIERYKHVREHTCRKLTSILTKLDTMMESSPYSGNKYFLHLQATASMMIADLLVPGSDDDTINDHDGVKAAVIRNKANVLLQRAMNHTKHSVFDLLDVSMRQACQNEQPRHQKFHLSLPIRGT